ncbi:MAG: PTS fructose transporter subunit IIA [Lachnospiraceae bacterium]|nr:PTS fructose transporter subunit IIA [Lachnospiraceae bacterium]
MKYVVLVSHGTFAPGLHSVLKMLGGGDRADVLSASMEDGMGADVFVERFQKTIAGIHPEDEIILLADIIGGSPLTNALDVLSQRGMLARTRAFGGMNLPMALTASMMKDALDGDTLAASLISESQNAIQEMKLALEEEEEADI